MGRIADVFNSLKQQGKKGFIPFITAGDPDLATTEELLVVQLLFIPKALSEIKPYAIL